MIADREGDRSKWIEAIKNAIAPAPPTPAIGVKASGSEEPKITTPRSAAPNVQEPIVGATSVPKPVATPVIDKRELFLSNMVKHSSAFLKAWVIANKDAFESLVTDDFELRVPLLNAEIKGSRHMHL